MSSGLLRDIQVHAFSIFTPLIFDKIGLYFPSAKIINAGFAIFLSFRPEARRCAAFCAGQRAG
ncbi:hypothetical protein [Pseudoduganella sp.]|uniref:hypothetical protein n=1 Tax=Pseudoduganella sp. TaxID=1880898 RepID=UPI0035B42A13